MMVILSRYTLNIVSENGKYYIFLTFLQILQFYPYPFLRTVLSLKRLRKEITP